MADTVSAHRTGRRSLKQSGDDRSAMVIESARGDRPRHTVRFGSVTVTVPTPSSAEVERNVRQSTQALKRLKARLLRPGVDLPEKKDVPLYSADEDNPGTFIRLLNGKRERGVLEKGEFKVT